MYISTLIRPRRDDPPVVPTSRWRQGLHFNSHFLTAPIAQNLYNDSAQMVLATATYSHCATGAETPVPPRSRVLIPPCFLASACDQRQLSHHS